MAMAYTPQNILHKTLLTLNFLNVCSASEVPAAQQHFSTFKSQPLFLKLEIPISYRDENEEWISRLLHHTGKGFLLFLQIKHLSFFFLNIYFLVFGRHNILVCMWC
ncbi:hypothetical protein H1C71_035898 [Ictidomys tridecemlineatus]|nr:hypothetical protein H1C71_035898 [Ictidomys tridecemlineatus]